MQAAAQSQADSRPTADEIRRSLAQHYGSAEFYRHPLSGLIYTEGIQDMADLCGAFWLIDVIASYQPQLCRSQVFREFQLWTITVDTEKRTGRVECREDSDRPPVVIQELEYTDFPLDRLDLYVESGTILLPSEH